MKLLSDRLPSRRLLDSFDVEREYESGQASRRIEPPSLTAEDRVFKVERVSRRERKRNLADQDAELEEMIEAAGATTIGCVAKCTSGQNTEWLREAADEAHKVGATVLLAVVTDRIIRHWDFHSIARPNLQATNEQIDEVGECVGGMRLMTRLHPDASPKECRSYRSYCGQKYKENKGGRPRIKPKSGTKLNRQQALPRVLCAKMCDKHLTYRDIQLRFGVNYQTAYRWWKSRVRWLNDPEVACHIFG